MSNIGLLIASLANNLSALHPGGGCPKFPPEHCGACTTYWRATKFVNSQDDPLPASPTSGNFTLAERAAADEIVSRLHGAVMQWATSVPQSIHDLFWDLHGLLYRTGVDERGER